MSHLSVGELSTTRLRPGTQALEGTEYLEVVKASIRDTNSPVSFAFDRYGQQVDGEQLLNQVHRRRLAKYGRIHESLYDRLQRTPLEGLIEVVVWPKVNKD